MGALRRRWGPLLVLLASVTCITLLLRATGVLTALGDQAEWAAVVERMRALAGRWWVGPVFAASYALLAGAALPALPLTVIGGAAFGLGAGFLWVTLGANLGGTLAFWLARWLDRDALAAILGPRIARFDRVTGAVGFQGVLTLRLLPVTPFSLFSYACGLTPIPWRSYALATLIGIVPGTLGYVFFAEALVAGSVEASRAALLRVLGAGLLLAILSLVSHRLLRRRISPGAGSGPGEGPA